MAPRPIPKDPAKVKFFRLATTADAFFVRTGDELLYQSSPITINGLPLMSSVRVMRDNNGNPRKVGENWFWEYRDYTAPGAPWKELGQASGPKDIERELLDKFERASGIANATEGYKVAGVWERFSLVRPGVITKTLGDVRREWHAAQ